MIREYASSVLLGFLGLFMALAVLSKIFLGFDIDSDWFWFLAVVGLTVEGAISFKGRQKFESKYKVVKKSDR